MCLVIFFVNWKFTVAIYAVFSELSVGGRSQDGRAADGQPSAGAVTEEQGVSRDGAPVMSGMQAATEAAVEDDVTHDEDGQMILC